jgi:hypothetical protein
MVNVINDKKLFNSMEIDREMKYQSLRFPKIFEPKENSFKLNKKLFCSAADDISTGLRNDFTARNKYSPVNRSRAFHREAG